nr:uncharacterized protein LOC127341269 [Lolium perenne]
MWRLIGGGKRREPSPTSSLLALRWPRQVACDLQVRDAVEVGQADTNSPWHKAKVTVPAAPCSEPTAEASGGPTVLVLLLPARSQTFHLNQAMGWNRSWFVAGSLHRASTNCNFGICFNSQMKIRAPSSRFSLFLFVSSISSTNQPSRANNFLAGQIPPFLLPRQTIDSS